VSFPALDNVKIQSSNNRNYNLEILRIISCFGIVLSHGNSAIWAREFGNISLIIFVFIAFYFLSPQKYYSSFISKRANRLLIPWLFWFFVYGLLHIIKGTSFLPVTGNMFSAVLNGTRMHLWYLPFLFITSVIIVFYYNTVEQHSILRKYNLVFFMFLSIIFLFAMPLWRPWSLVLGVPWGNWFIVFPALFIGTTLANLKNKLSDYWKIILYMIIIILISTWLTLSGQWLGRPYLFSILLFVTAIHLKFDITRHSNIIMKLSNCTYGIYLIHPLIGTIGDKLGFSQNLSPYLTYALSLLVIILANKVPGPFIKKLI
jgi:hypothetical protein